MARITPPGGGTLTITGYALGGDLTGTPDNAQYGAGSIVDADVSPSTGIARTKVAALEGRHVLGSAGEPALASGWSAFEPVSYWLDPLTERVQFQGILKRTGAYTSGTTIFTLPTGYRPVGSVNRDLYPGKFVASVGATLLQIGPSGIVFIGENLVDQTYIYLDDKGFRI